MSESEEEENFCFFGKPLEPYDEDTFPKKKPISIEDQVATDAQGRRRFHGAFTGGFSAGFFNTVGSLEGWTPREFKSTRQDKAQSKSQKPEDFMDDEDIGEFGIAPQTVRATSDYSTSRKRKKQVFNDGPIPGEPVLHSLLTSGNETIGYLLLKNIGLKDKGDVQESQHSSEEKVYGCEMPRTYEISRNDDVYQYVIPDIYKEFLQKPKDNTFGLGYEGLNKSHINLFKSSNLVIKEANNKKVSISGQAFGVGAFEEDDEDIYVKDDMTRYDFELTAEKVLKKDTLSKNDQTIFDEFIMAKDILAPKEIYLPPTIPHSFTGKHKIKRSRFEPLPSETETPERKDMNPEIRARYLGEAISTPDISKTSTPVNNSTSNVQSPSVHEDRNEEVGPPKNTRKSFDLFSLNSSGLVFDRFVSSSEPEDPSNILEEVKPSVTTHGTQEMRDAAKMKMFGPLTRITSDWQPCSLLCKRFNVPEPHSDELNASRNKKRTKNLIFEYEQFKDVSVNLQAGLSMQDDHQNIDKNKDNSSVNLSQDKVEENNRSIIPNAEEATTSLVSKGNNDNKEESAGEPPKDITDKIDVNKNIDLFKAVFLSSSESEDEEDKRNEEEKNVEMKTSILSDNLLPRIKPIKSGILSDISSIFEKPSDVTAPTTANNELKMSDIVEEDEPSYGPTLPSALSTSKCGTSDVSFQYHDDDDINEWVEKTQKDKKSKTGHKRKHKSKKSSHKKKHKHSKERSPS